MAGLGTGLVGYPVSGAAPEAFEMGVRDVDALSPAVVAAKVGDLDIIETALGSPGAPVLVPPGRGYAVAWGHQLFLPRP